MKGMERFPSHPARDMSIRSVTAVEAGDREGWLALFAPDGFVEDPIGSSPLNPTGEPHRGHDAIGAFYDNVITQGRVEFDANFATITTTFPDGARAIVDVVSTYRLDGDGRLASLRAYWEFERMRFEPA
jgi:steroid delta-isomerase